MLLKWLESLALENLEGKGIAYTFDAVFVLKYALLIFFAHFIIYVAIKRNRFSGRTYFPKFFFWLYFIVIIGFTVLPIDFPGINDTVVNLNFSLKPILSAFSSRAGLINFAGNILLFVPVPILGLVAKMKVFDKWRNAGLFSIIVSVLIELVQYIEAVNGYSDLVVVDIVDIITNTIGGLTGWVIFKFYQKNHI